MTRQFAHIATAVLCAGLVAGCAGTGGHRDWTRYVDKTLNFEISYPTGWVSKSYQPTVSEVEDVRHDENSKIILIGITISPDTVRDSKLSRFSSVQVQFLPDAACERARQAAHATEKSGGMEYAVSHQDNVDDRYDVTSYLVLNGRYCLAVYDLVRFDNEPRDSIPASAFKSLRAKLENVRKTFALH
jgi:hypothetical protein